MVIKNYDISMTEVNIAIKNTHGDKGEQLIWKNVNKILFSLYSLFSVRLLPLMKRMLF